MKKIAVVLAVIVLVASVMSFAIAAETKMGTIKSVDAKAGTVVLTVDGKDMALKADKGVDLSKCKAGDKIEASIEHDMLKGVKEAAAPKAKPKAAVGC